MLQRDVPPSKRAYEYFLRGNQLSHDAKQWSVARDLYQRCVEEDPRYAPAWARLGRIHHVMAKYLETGTHEESRSRGGGVPAGARAQPRPDDRAQAVRAARSRSRARARRDGAARERAHSADPELLAGLVSTCRYCGLLDASARRPRARASPRSDASARACRTRGSCSAITSASRRSSSHENPYIVALSLGGARS